MSLYKLLAKKYKAYSGNDTPQLERLRLNELGLDMITGGGLPLGLVTQVYGLPSACKTTLTMYIAKQFLLQGHDVVFVDAERTMFEDRVKTYGLDQHGDSFIVVKPTSGVEALQITMEAAIGGAKLIIVDSVPQLLGNEAEQKEIGSVSIASQARLLAQEMPKIISAIQTNNSALIFINQIRNKTGGYGNPTTTPGGFTLKHALFLNIELARSETLKDGSGIKIRAKTQKNKGFVEGKTSEFFVSFPGALIDPMFSLKDGMELAGLIQRRGSYYQWVEDNSFVQSIGLVGDQAKIGQGQASVVRWLESNPSYKETIYNYCLDYLIKQNSIASEDLLDDE